MSLSRRTVAAFLIDPAERTVEPIWVGTDLEDLYAACACDVIDIRTISRDGICLVIDDEGLLKPNPKLFRLWGNTFAGRALMSRNSTAGDLVSLPDIGPLTTARLRSTVEWVDTDDGWEPSFSTRTYESEGAFVISTEVDNLPE